MKLSLIFFFFLHSFFFSYFNKFNFCSFISDLGYLFKYFFKLFLYHFLTHLNVYSNSFYLLRSETVPVSLTVNNVAGHWLILILKGILIAFLPITGVKQRIAWPMTKLVTVWEYQEAKCVFRLMYNGSILLIVESSF